MLIVLVEAWASIRASSIPLVLPISMGYRAIIEEIRRRHVSDPRDRYFASLGLLEPEQSDLSPQPRPTMSCGLDFVYSRLSRDIIQAYKPLEILLYATVISTPESVTWVVDWQTVSDKWVKSRWHQTGLGKFSTYVFTRSIIWPSTTGILDERPGTMPLARTHFKFDQEGRHLVMCGIVLSTKFEYLSDEFLPITANTSPNGLRASADAINTAIEGLDAEKAGISEYFLCQLRWFASLSEPFGSGPPSGYYFFLFIAGGVFRKLRALFSRLRDVLPCFAKQSAERDTVHHLWRVIAGYHDPMSPSTARKVHEQVISFLAQEDMRLIRFRYLGGTLNGGVAPGTTKMDDVVAFIAGVPMLMVLRLVERNRYTIVGPLFTSAFANGALMRRYREDGVNMVDLGEKIMLC